MGNDRIEGTDGVRRLAWGMLAKSPLLIVALLGCAQVRGMVAFQRELASEFNAPGVSVLLTDGRDLQVIFPNRLAETVQESERSSFALRAALFARDHFPGYQTVQSIRIGFARAKSIGPLSSSVIEVPYVFSRSELELLPRGSGG